MKTQFWKVTLGNSYHINMVLIYNRMDCCQERINEAEVWADKHICGKVFYEANRQTYSVSCNGVKASEVSVKLSTGNYLSLSEVQVFGKWV